ncbi:MAG: metallophosphoesterase [Saprospiraceae bacterium]|nr:metallophosphoesterase [Saprospiraceae bacterium]
MVRILILSVILLVIDFYIYQPFLTAIAPWSRPIRLTASILFWSIPLLATFWLIALQTEWITPGQAGRFRSVFQSALFLVYLCKVIVLPFVLIDDLRRGVLWVSSLFGSEPSYLPGRSRFLSTLGLAAGALPFSLLLYGMWRNPYRYRIHRASIPVRNLPTSLEGLRIVQISDIHSGSFTMTEPVENAIDMVLDLQPDLILFTGDLVNSKASEMAPFLSMFSRLKAPAGVYSILGNHDYGDYHNWPSEEAKRANFEQLVETHAKLGWDLLRNEHRILQIRGEELALIGVENYSTHARFPKYGDLTQALTGCAQVPLKILMSHDPSHWEAQVKGQQPDIFLTLSGHTHGMQFGVEIPGWMKWSPIQYVYKQWAGLYQEAGQYLYVNRGLGFLGYPGRVGILPEITLLELTGKNPSDSIS